MRIFLVGLMGTGKSTVGRRLSAQTGWPYLDNDRLVEAATGRTAPGIMADAGEAGLHAAEMAAFEHALTIPEPVIIGVAGFVVTDAAARVRLRGEGVVVWLRASPTTMRTRAGSAAGRRSEAVSLDWIERVAAEREPWFREVADLEIRTDAVRPAAIVEAILAMPRVAEARGRSSGS